MAVPFDDDVPALHALLSDGGRGLLGSLAAERGLQLSAVRATQVRYVPGRSVVAQFRAALSDGGSHPIDETWIAASGEPLPEGLPIFGIGDTTVALWRYPDDPYLPGLAPAADPDRLASILRQLGVDPAGEIRIRRRSYRPGRRAVLEVTLPPHRLFVKVVRPDRVADLQQRHERMAAHLPVPHTLGWSGEFGVVVLQAMPGVTLRDQLEAGLQRSPSAAALLRLLEALPPSDPVDHRGGPIDRLPANVRLLSAVVPTHRNRLDDLVGRIGSVAEGPAVPVHGDFHSSQVLVDAEAIVGLIDVDTAGMGERSNDLAVLLAHLAMVARRGQGRGRAHVDRYRRELLAVFAQQTAVDELHRLVAAAIIGFATGPFRVQLANWPTETASRITEAERWLDGAPW